MKVQEVILRALGGALTWIQAAEILGIHTRSLRRWRARYEARRRPGAATTRRRPPRAAQSPRRGGRSACCACTASAMARGTGTPASMSATSTTSPAAITACGCPTASSSSRCRRPDSCAKAAPRAAIGAGASRGRASGSSCTSTAAPMRGSPCGPTERQTLIAVLDDATKRLLYAQLWPARRTEAVMSALREVFQTYGLPIALYTDRAGWAFYTPTAGGKVDPARPTQLGRALAPPRHRAHPQLLPPGPRPRRTAEPHPAGPAHQRTAAWRASPRSRRPMPICATDSSPTTTRSSPIRPATPPAPSSPSAPPTSSTSSATRRSAPSARTTSSSSTGIPLQIPKQPGRRTCAGLRVTVRRHLDGRHSVWRGTQCLGRLRCPRPTAARGRQGDIEIAPPSLDGPLRAS